MIAPPFLQKRGALEGGWLQVGSSCSNEKVLLSQHLKSRSKSLPYRLKAFEFCVYFQAAKVDSTNANIFVHRGLLALQARADVNGARELIQKAIKVDPKCEFAYETLGTLEVINLSIGVNWIGIQWFLVPCCELFEKP